MKEVCLQFEAISAMTNFLSVLENNNCEINRQRLTILCEISAEELELAIRSFGACVVDIYQ
jgi:hypothetical protein